MGNFLTGASHTHPPNKLLPSHDNPIQRESRQFGGSAFASQECFPKNNGLHVVRSVKAGEFRATAGVMPDSSYVPGNERYKPYLTAEESKPIGKLSKSQKEGRVSMNSNVSFRSLGIVLSWLIAGLISGFAYYGFIRALAYALGRLGVKIVGV